MPEIDLTTHQRVVDRLIGRFFSEPIIENVWRGDYVECMIEALLAPDWHLTGTWDMWDLEHESGARIEIKTSSALQTWTTDKPSLSPSFDIKPRVEMWDQQTATAIPISPQRLADIYLFAWHPEIRRDLADHRLPEQWQFFIVPERHFYPSQKTISLGRVRGLTNEHGAATDDHRDLHENIETIRKALPTLKANSPIGSIVAQSGSQTTQTISKRPDVSGVSSHTISDTAPKDSPLYKWAVRIRQACPKNDGSGKPYWPNAITGAGKSDGSDAYEDAALAQISDAGGILKIELPPTGKAYDAWHGEATLNKDGTSFDAIVDGVGDVRAVAKETIRHPAIDDSHLLEMLTKSLSQTVSPGSE